MDSVFASFDFGAPVVSDLTCFDSAAGAAGSSSFGFSEKARSEQRGMMSGTTMLQIEIPRTRRNGMSLCSSSPFPAGSPFFAASLKSSPGWSLMDLNDSSLPDSPAMDLNYDYAFTAFDNKAASASPMDMQSSAIQPMTKGDAFMDLESTSLPLAHMDYLAGNSFVLGELRPLGEAASHAKPKLMEEVMLERSSTLDKVFAPVADEPKPEAVVEQAPKPLENNLVPAALPVVSAAPAASAPAQFEFAKPQPPAPESKRSRRKPEPAVKSQQPVTYTKPVPAIFAASTVPDPRDNEIVIGIYTRAERRAKILRYKQKRAKHVYIKGNQYECRRRFAVARPRVGGRFTKLKNLPEEESAPKAPDSEGLEYAASDD